VGQDDRVNPTPPARAAASGALRTAHPAGAEGSAGAPGGAPALPRLPRPRLIATDLDGTLLRDDGTVSPRTVAALAAAEAAGVEVVFVTGRPTRWLGAVAEHTARHGMVICANGAAVYDPRRAELLDSHPLAPADALRAARALRAAVPGTSFAVEGARGFGYEPGYAPLAAEPTSVRAPVDELLAPGGPLHAAWPVLKLLAQHPDAEPDAFLDRARAVGGSYGDFTRSSPTALLEMSAAGVSKATTLAWCCARRGIAAREVVAFGDMPNDLPMLGWAGTSFAVANAHPLVLDAVTYRTTANEDDGVARVIERLLDAV
jgi:hydroxymethylpyrimidine pyrophosphatase-like HAD family hydrolase